MSYDIPEGNKDGVSYLKKTDDDVCAYVCIFVSIGFGQSPLT